MKSQDQAHAERDLALIEKLVTRYVTALNNISNGTLDADTRQIAMYAIQKQIDRMQLAHAAAHSIRLQATPATERIISENEQIQVDLI